MLGDLVGIYAAAMGATPGELPGRQAIMERHTANPGFRVLTATTGERPIAFAYGFRGTAGQWWHESRMGRNNRRLWTVSCPVLARERYGGCRGACTPRLPGPRHRPSYASGAHNRPP